MKKYFIFLIIVLLLVGAMAYFGRQTADPNRKINWGVTFDKTFLSKFNLDWQIAYLAVLDDLKVKQIRLSARWNETEPQEDKFNFTDLDWQIEEAVKRNVKIILAVGYKLPRWPECHEPDWAQNQESVIRNRALMRYLEAVIVRYKNNQAIYVWQVENEPFLPFGECPKFNKQLLDKEIALIKGLDTRLVLITDSGELSFWARAAKRGDIFGTTMYRWVWNEYLGSYKYPLPPAFFRIKEKITRLFVGREKPFIVIELQGEPWTHKQIYEIPIEQQLSLMPLAEFNETIDYAKQTGFSDYYLWGVEWWYYLRQNGHGEYWEMVKQMIKENG